MARSAHDEVLLELARSVVAISTHAADRLGTVSVVQLRALTVLRELGTANLGRLAESLDVTPSTTSRLVDRLVTAGLVDRRVSERTRRELALQVSRAGRAALDRYDQLRLEELRRGLTALPGERRDEVAAALGDFAAGMRRPVAGVAS